MPSRGLRGQPLLAAALSFAAGLYLPCAFACAGLAIAWAVIIGLRPPGARRRRPTCAALLLIGIPLLLGAWVPARSENPSALPAGPCTIEGLISGPPRPVLRSQGDGPSGVFLRAPARIEALNGSAGTLDTTLFIPGEPPIGRGMRFRARLVARAESRTLAFESPTQIEWRDASVGVAALLDRGRARMRRGWQKRFEPGAAAWLSALLLGDRGLLPEGTLELFRRIGQSHIIAISGLHVAVIFALLYVPLRRWSFLGDRTCALVVSACVLLYAELTGGEAPVLRAALFGLLVALAVLRRHRAPLLNRLAMSFLLLAAGCPAEAVGPGFVLTFAAVCGIALFQRSERVPPIADRGPLRRVVDALGVQLRISLGAWLGASAALVFYSPEVVPWGPVFALLLMPPFVLLLALGLVAMLPPLPLIEPALAAALQGAAQLFDTCALALDELPGTPWLWPLLPPASLALAIASFACWCRIRERFALAPLLLGGSVICALAPVPEPAVVLPDLGRSQALLACARTATVVFDGGSIDFALGGAPALRDELRARGRGAVDLVIVSHAHADHMLAWFVLSDAIRVGALVVGPRFDEAPLGAALVGHFERRGIPVLRAARGDRCRVGGLDIEFLHPRRELPLSLPVGLNDDSLVARLRGNGLDLLVTGDLQEDGMALFDDPPRTDLLVLPHHGRWCADLPAWVERIGPRTVLATSSSAIPPELRDWLHEAGLRGYSTGEVGTIRLVERDGCWRVPAEVNGEKDGDGARGY